jgi:hypothetical protein
MHIKPKNWSEFFEFLKYSKVKSVLKEMAIATAKAGASNG